ncbi:putative Xaa-Pro aminopeptidase P [Gracilariopsis chorda]|uniref:Putative Xaa-Pro aminopeptidase P n=1 Tax=Gracilariopsis chorda TaxID=448386 RepID=A0A2V3IT63_9FLOR|nr:putative Xaa-Pro aminopeptidase P [Gracilariopsis chorda]|eukprot:PXF45313.1 putative Xaa-Pro aminopeptidase P [Gracilariopsis chorda]
MTSLRNITRSVSSRGWQLPAAFLGSNAIRVHPRNESLFLPATSKRNKVTCGRVSRRAPSVLHMTTSSSSSPRHTTDHRLAALREELRKQEVQAMIIPTRDPHFSEYAPPCYAYRNFISNFTGSAGTAVVTLDGAFLWTDGRYFLQAENELDSNWTLMKAGLPETPSIHEFVVEILPKGSAVGVDPFLHSIDFVKKFEEVAAEEEIRLVHLDCNPVELVWGSDRPPKPNGEVRVHDIQYSGKSITEKLEPLREAMEEKDCSHILLSMLDEVCWLYNIRGTDIPHNPVVLSYALVSKETSRLYVNQSQLTSDVLKYLSSSGVEVHPYEKIKGHLRDVACREETVWIDPNSTSIALKEALGDFAVAEATPVKFAKACKNEAELQGMREAHIRDGIALSSFLCWLEDYVNTNEQTISEFDAAVKLREFRAKQSGFLDVSFPTIAGFGPNGAIIHYNPSQNECGEISNKKVFLLDSGGQYVDGTTDVTRTMHLGATPTDHEKECFTRVLQGHIGIDTAVYPEDTTGFMLDALARVPLWSIGLDYRHGTGHGVGACLNVHEGPHSISPRISSNYAGLKAGMIVSNEPGYYEDGHFGIRIENLLYVVKKQTAHHFGGKDYLGFKRLTYVPIDASMINWSLLSTAEVRWMNQYHQNVWDTLSPRMQAGRYKDWLWEKTRPVQAGQLQPASQESVGVTPASA